MEHNSNRNTLQFDGRHKESNMCSNMDRIFCAVNPIIVQQGLIQQLVPNFIEFIICTCGFWVLVLLFNEAKWQVLGVFLFFNECHKDTLICDCK